MFREWWQIRPSTFFHQKSWCCRFLWHMLKFSNFQKWRILRVETKYSKISRYCAMKIGHFLWSGLKSRNGISEQKMVQKSSLFRFMGQNENSCHIRKFWKCPKIDFSQNSFKGLKYDRKCFCFECILKKMQMDTCISLGVGSQIFRIRETSSFIVKCQSSNYHIQRHPPTILMLSLTSYHASISASFQI